MTVGAETLVTLFFMAMTLLFAALNHFTMKLAQKSSNHTLKVIAKWERSLEVNRALFNLARAAMDHLEPVATPEAKRELHALISEVEAFDAWALAEEGDYCEGAQPPDFLHRLGDLPFNCRACEAVNPRGAQPTAYSESLPAESQVIAPTCSRASGGGSCQ